jgi:CheY-like chemotaxis protein
VQPGRSPRILWAEDQPEDRYLIEEALKELKFGGHVAFVEDGRAAVEAVEAGLPDRVVLDIGMPRMSGLDALRRLRARPESTNLPISVFTGLEDPSLERMCRSLGVNPFVNKPVHLPAFTVGVRHALALPERASAPR